MMGVFISVLHEVPLSVFSLGYSIAVLGRSTEENSEGVDAGHPERGCYSGGGGAATLRAQQGVLGSRARAAWPGLFC